MNNMKTTWTLETFENDKVKLTLSLISNEHYRAKDHRDDTKTFYNIRMDIFTTQDHHKGDEWQEDWYDENFASFAAAYNTFEFFQMIK